LAADFHPGVDVDDRVQLGGEANDGVVVGVTANDAAGIAPVVLNADAWALANPLFHLAAALHRLRWIDGNQARNSIGVLFEVLANLFFLIVR